MSTVKTGLGSVGGISRSVERKKTHTVQLNLHEVQKQAKLKNG